MRKIITIFLLAVSITCFSQPPPSPEEDKFYQILKKEINPSHVAWINRAASQVNSSKLEENSIRVMVNNYALQNKIVDAMSIDALIFMVLLESSRLIQEELKTSMNDIKNNNIKKEVLRKAQDELEKNESQLSRGRVDSLRGVVRNIDQANQIKTNNIAKAGTVQSPRKEPLTTNNTITATIMEINNVKESIKNKLDSISEMTEQVQLRFQIYMDRRSKFISTLSNIMKKISETQSQIISNLK